MYIVPRFILQKKIHSVPISEVRSKQLARGVIMSSSDEIPESGPTPRSTQRFTSASADLERRFLSS